MNIDVEGAVHTPAQTAEFGAALLQDLAHALPSLGFAPVAVVLTQHERRPDGVQPALLAVLGESGAASQLLDVARTGMSTVFNDVLPRVTPTGTAAVAPPQPPAPEPTYATPPAVATAEPVVEAIAAPGHAAPEVGAVQIWEAFEEAVRPQLGRGAAKAVQASRKAAGGMSDAELLDFLTERLANFGTQAVETFQAALRG